MRHAFGPQYLSSRIVLIPDYTSRYLEYVFAFLRGNAPSLSLYRIIILGEKAGRETACLPRTVRKYAT